MGFCRQYYQKILMEEFGMSTKRKFYRISFLVCFLLFITTFIFAYKYFALRGSQEKFGDGETDYVQEAVEEEEEELQPAKNSDSQQTQEISREPIIQDHTDVETAMMEEDRIKPYTKIIYEYYYAIDDKLVTKETQPPYYLLDMTREEVAESYPDWQLQSFSSENVVFRKSLNEKNSTGYFTVGVYEGYVAVFYEDGRLREVTQTPIASLPEAEQEKLREGISIYGEEDLIKILEDYTS